VGGAAAFAGDFALTLRVHGSEAPVGFAALVALIVGSHVISLQNYVLELHDQSLLAML
jgi:hypothetical protein